MNDRIGAGLLGTDPFFQLDLNFGQNDRICRRWALVNVQKTRQ